MYTGSLRKKANVINAIKNAKSQPEIKNILDKNFTTTQTSYEVIGNNKKKFAEKVDTLVSFIAKYFDIDYKTGIDNDLGSDGKTHDFGKGKFAHRGDNIPDDLSHAKRAVIKCVKEY